MPALAEAQLDIIADTALAADPRLAPRIVVRQPSAAAPAHSGSATDAKADPRIAAIDARRRAALMTHAELCRLAGVELNNWHRLRRGEHPPTDKTVKKLEAALTGGASPRPPQLIASYHRLVMVMIAAELNFPLTTLLATDFTAQRPQVPDWRAAARIRNMAIYITTVELEVSNADAARALNVSREAIRKARNRVEDMRDHAAIDKLLTRVREQARAG